MLCSYGRLRLCVPFPCFTFLHFSFVFYSADALQLLNHINWRVYIRTHCIMYGWQLDHSVAKAQPLHRFQFERNNTVSYHITFRFIATGKTWRKLLKKRKKRKEFVSLVFACKNFLLCSNRVRFKHSSYCFLSMWNHNIIYFTQIFSWFLRWKQKRFLVLVFVSGFWCVFLCGGNKHKIIGIKKSFFFLNKKYSNDKVWSKMRVEATVYCDRFDSHFWIFLLLRQSLPARIWNILMRKNGEDNWSSRCGRVRLRVCVNLLDHHHKSQMGFEFECCNFKDSLRLVCLHFSFLLSVCFRSAWVILKLWHQMKMLCHLQYECATSVRCCCCFYFMEIIFCFFSGTLQNVHEHKCLVSQQV